MGMSECRDCLERSSEDGGRGESMGGEGDESERVGDATRSSVRFDGRVAFWAFGLPSEDAGDIGSGFGGHAGDEVSIGRSVSMGASGGVTVSSSSTE